MYILFVLFLIALSTACGGDDAALEASRTFPARSACVEGVEASEERRPPLSGEPVTAVELGAPTRLVLPNRPELPNRPDQHCAVALGSLGADMSMQLMVISPSFGYNYPDDMPCVNLNYSSQEDVWCEGFDGYSFGYFDHLSALIYKNNISGRYFYYKFEDDYNNLRLSTKVYREGQLVLDLPQVRAQSVVTPRGLQLVTAGDELAALSKAGEVVWSLKGSSMPERFIEFYAAQAADHREGEPLTMLARSEGGVSLLEIDDCGGYKVRYTLDKDGPFSHAAHIGARMVVVSGWRDTHIYNRADGALLAEWPCREVYTVDDDEVVCLAPSDESSGDQLRLYDLRAPTKPPKVLAAAPRRGFISAALVAEDRHLVYLLGSLVYVVNMNTGDVRRLDITFEEGEGPDSLCPQSLLLSEDGTLIVSSRGTHLIKTNLRGLADSPYPRGLRVGGNGNMRNPPRAAP